MVGALSPAARRRIEALAVELKQKTGAEMAVLVVRSTRPRTSSSYGMRVVEAWKLGRRAGGEGARTSAAATTACSCVVAIDDRRMHLFIGYGLEGVIPDGRAGAILDRYVMPAFREGDVDRGVYDGLRAAAEIVAE